MTATPNLASNALAETEAAGATAAAASGAFVLNLCSSTTPMALPQADLPELRRFTFFVSRRFEEGRERFRLHMGYFATLAEAEEWLSLVREIYPGAWAGETPGRKLRERATAAAADQARFAAGPQTEAPPSQMPWMPAARPAAFAPPTTRPAAPPTARPAARQSSAGAAPSMTPRSAPAVVPTAAPPPRVASPAARTIGQPPSAPQAAAARAASPAVNAPRPPAAVPANRAAARPPSKAPSAPATARGAASPSAPAATRHAAVPPRAGAARGAAPPPLGRAAKESAKGVFQDSYVREVLNALADASATGETRMMPAPSAPPPPRPAVPSIPEVQGNGGSSLSDTQVLKLLDKRRTEGAPPPPAEIDDGGISLLKPDDTQTRRALREAVATNAPVAFAVQLLWSVQAVELDKVPPLAIFAAYTLYTVEGSREGRKWYGLRLGFFSDAISAKQVAYYVRSEFSSVAVVPVSPQEKGRATGQETAAVSMPAPTAPRSTRPEEFKLIDDNEITGTHEPVRPAPAARPQPQAAPRRPGKAPATPPPADAARQGAPSRGGARGNSRVGARDRRGPQTLDETLEILGASELSIDADNQSALSDSGVRHLQVEVQKNSSFSRLLERLSERVKKP